jgi:hypothetical protein
LFAVLIVAFLVLLPQPSVVVQPAIQGDRTDLDRLGVLEDALYRSPGDVGAAVELSRAYLRVEQPGWAIATLGPFQTRGDYLVHQVSAYAYATLLLPDMALKQAETGLAACATQGPRCPEAAQIRLSYLADLMREQATKGIDPTSQPLAAKRAVQSALRSTHASSTQSKPAPAVKPAPAKGPAAPAPSPVAPAPAPPASQPASQHAP